MALKKTVTVSNALATILPTQPVVFDRSHWGRIQLTGKDRVRFLHNQTTNDIEQLSAGQGCHTVFVTSTGRTIDLVSVYALPESLWLSVSPDMAKTLYDWMDRYIFFSDKVTLADKSDETFMFTLVGEKADSVLQKIGAEAIAGQPEFSHQQVTLSGIDLSCQIAASSDLACQGYTLWGDKGHARDVWQALIEAGALSGTTEQWEQLRIQQGRPMPHQELTDDDNPLEAGLWRCVSFEKGCYIGQETIARLNTYQGVKKRLWGLALTAPSPVGTPIYADGNKVGKLASIVQTDAGPLGLAYIRTKAGGIGLTVEIDGQTAQVTAPPFIVHEYYAPGEK